MVRKGARISNVADASNLFDCVLHIGDWLCGHCEFLMRCPRAESITRYDAGNDAFHTVLTLLDKLSVLVFAVCRLHFDYLHGLASVSLGHSSALNRVRDVCILAARGVDRISAGCDSAKTQPAMDGNRLGGSHTSRHFGASSFVDRVDSIPVSTHNSTSDRRMVITSGRKR